MQATTTAPAPAAITDEEIVARVRAGETHLFELVMRRHNRRIFRAARAILRDDHEAEDVMQDAYVRAYAHLHEFEGVRASRRGSHGSPSTRRWLAAPRTSLPVASMSSARSKAMVRHDAPMNAASPETNAGDREMRVSSTEAIDALSDDYRAVFVLRAVEEMSGAETAECLGIPEET